MLIHKHDMTSDQFDLIASTKERDAVRWMYIEIIERDGIARKCEIMNEIHHRLLPVRHHMIGRPFNVNDQASVDDYHNRIGSMSQSLDYNCGNGKNMICRQTGGVNGRLSFKEGGCETAKEAYDYNNKGIAFISTLDIVTNPPIIEVPINDEAEPAPPAEEVTGDQLESIEGQHDEPQDQPDLLRRIIYKIDSWLNKAAAFLTGV